MNRDPRFALSMDESAQRETPHLGIFWVVQTPDGEARLLSAGWLDWLERLSGTKSPPPPMGGTATAYAPLCDAPGTYVLEP